MKISSSNDKNPIPNVTVASRLHEKFWWLQSYCAPTNTRNLNFFASCKKIVINIMASLKNDFLTMAAGALAWGCAIPAVKFAGKSVANRGHTPIALVAGLSIAYGTTPLMAYVLNWGTSEHKVRGIALALGTAQVLDGLMHIFLPTFYSKNHNEGIASAGSIFFAAGLLGIFSAYA